MQRHWHWHKCVRFGETFWMSDARVTWKDIWGCCRILRFRDGGEKQRTLPNKRGDERQTNVLHSNSSGLVYMNCDIAAGMITKFVLFVYFSGGHIRVMWAHSGDEIAELHLHLFLSRLLNTALVSSSVTCFKNCPKNFSFFAFKTRRRFVNTQTNGFEKLHKNVVRLSE